MSPHPFGSSFVASTAPEAGRVAEVALPKPYEVEPRITKQAAVSTDYLPAPDRGQGSSRCRSWRRLAAGGGATADRGGHDSRQAITSSWPVRLSPHLVELDLHGVEDVERIPLAANKPLLGSPSQMHVVVARASVIRARNRAQRKGPGNRPPCLSALLRVTGSSPRLSISQLVSSRRCDAQSSMCAEGRCGGPSSD